MMNRTVCTLTLTIIICGATLNGANSRITVQGNGVSANSAHISVTSAAELCPDEYEVQSGASLTTWDPSAICSATTSGDGDISLPVELTSLTAAVDDDLVRLQWSTASEVNNLGFIIRKSLSEAGPFQEIASYESHEGLAGAGNSSSRNDYTYEDRNVIPGNRYWYLLVDIDFAGEMVEHGPVSAFFATEDVPLKFELHPNSPNPFNPETRIAYELPVPSKVSLKIFDVQGRLVRSLESNAHQPAGRYSRLWEGRNESGHPVASGMYFYRLTALRTTGGAQTGSFGDSDHAAANHAAGFTRTRPMLLIR